MKRARYYYRLCEAEKLKETYSSWINKKVHIGAGQFETLKSITITPKRPVINVKPEELFIVKFEFYNTKKIDAWTFLTNNGLISGSEAVEESDNYESINHLDAEDKT